MCFKSSSFHSSPGTKEAFCLCAYFYTGVRNVPAGSETMTWILSIGPLSSEKKHKGISIVMVWCVAMTTPPLFRAAMGLLEGTGGAEIQHNIVKRLLFSLF